MIVMGKTNQTPSASKTASISKRSRNEESPGATSPAGNDSTDILTSIDKKLFSFDARLSLLEIPGITGVVGVQPATGANAGCRKRSPQRIGEITHRRTEPDL